ncbi:MAG: triphosphoribosyl-dephospho-CoA synthase CitG [Synergistaceae bacterium]|nr:triphosphoribosyl-dephospho-CoA synthase CitG [Synergistaceae bacterium]
MMKMITNKIIGTLALEAMLVEVSVTPKPGLVDRNNSGAHSDMGFFTFLKSAAGLRSCFEEFSEAGHAGGTKNFSPDKIFPYIRKIGIEAEKIMFDSTNGINTHKGEIFSLGVLSASAGYLAGMKQNINPEDVMKTAGMMCKGLCERDFAEAKTKSPEQLTKGERIYREHGITGIRGEAESGYPVVRDYALPALRKYIADGLCLNDSLVMTLIHIMAHNDDTNIIARHDLSVCEEVKERSRDIIMNHGGIDEIRRLDDEFIKRNISPSGSADLLAVTYFLFTL